MTENATARLLKPSHQPKADEPLQRDHFQDALPEQRCGVHSPSLTRRAMVTGIGRHVDLVVCLRPPVQPRPGWGIDVRIDGEADWSSFEVMSVEPNAMFTELTVRSMG